MAREEAVDFANMVNARLDLGCMCTIVPESLISLVEFFSSNAPELRLIIHEDTGRQLAQKLIDGEIDVAILALPTVPEELHAYPLFEEDYVIAFPRDHRFRSMESVSLSDLEGERYLSRVNCEYLDAFRTDGSSFEITLDDRFESENENWVQAMVIADLGCAIMPESLARHPVMHYRPLVSPLVRRTVCVVTRRGRRHSPVVEFFVNVCKNLDRNQGK